MTLEELSKLRDAELDRLAAEQMEPEPVKWGRKNDTAYGSEDGWWATQQDRPSSLDDNASTNIIPAKHATQSRDVAALLEAKAIEQVGEPIVAMHLRDASTGYSCFAPARQRTIAALACLMESEDGKEKENWRMKWVHTNEAYQDLILAVCRKFPGETRHQTAKRYIQEIEQSPQLVGSEKESEADDASS